jgi:hypothetical protein
MEASIEEIRSSLSSEEQERFDEVRHMLALSSLDDA